MKSSPKLRVTILYLIIGWTAFIISLSVQYQDKWLSLGLFGVAFIFGFAAAVSFWNWVRFANAARKKDNSMAAVAGDLAIAQARNAFIRELEVLTPDQMELIGKYQAVIKVIPGEPDGPAYVLTLPGGDVRWDFVEEFMNKSRGMDLAEVRQWSDGSWRRISAEIITAYFMMMGYARPPSGNRPATWISRERACKAIHWEEEDGTG